MLNKLICRKCGSTYYSQRTGNPYCWTCRKGVSQTTTIFVCEAEGLKDGDEGTFIVNGEYVYARLKIVKHSSTEEMLKGQAFGL
jgi:hypothetical protein